MSARNLGTISRVNIGNTVSMQAVANVAASSNPLSVLRTELDVSQPLQLTVGTDARDFGGPGTTDLPVLIIVKWGAGGGQTQQVQIDLRHGFSVPLHASFVEVLAYPLAIPVGAVSGNLRAHIGGGVHFNLRVTRTAEYGPIAAAGNETDFIPPFAAGFEVWSQNATVTATIEVLDNAGLVVLTRSFGAGGNQTVPNLPADAAAIRITNTGGVAAMFTIVYTLAL